MNIFNNDNHADNTWTDKKSGTHWLRDLLPSRCPNARILTYQYNANVAFGASSAGIEEQAKNMLRCIWLERKSNSVRPIIFIAHSMGGIIVKEALALAFHDDKAYPMIWVFTFGIVFFGVPHRGSEYGSWEGVVANIVRTSLNRPGSSFLSSVESGSAYNEQLNARFQPLLSAFMFLSVCETLPEETPQGISLGTIVHKDSAILGLSDREEIKIYPNCTHRTICKFASATEPEWKQVSDIICYAAMRTVNSFDYSPTIHRRKKMFENLSWHLEGTCTPMFCILR
ncbi:hypothetical protein BKA56DRAFT_701408 [Ilyonectria sp. MPI-CAGE-AT-0026]|nr:hypothetical protein BKA56DRAFT_701408 [Ilyonectria sp. MPI-CAGE-AT-0026]